MGRSRYTEAQIAAVLELRRAGHNAQYIGITLGIPISTVYTMCRRAGFGGNGRGRKRSTHYDHDKIAGLRPQGLSTRAIAEHSNTFCPPLVMTDDEVDRVVDALATATRDDG